MPRASRPEEACKPSRRQPRPAALAPAGSKIWSLRPATSADLARSRRSRNDGDARTHDPATTGGAASTKAVERTSRGRKNGTRQTTTCSGSKSVGNRHNAPSPQKDRCGRCHVCGDSFGVGLVDGPGRREEALRHSMRIYPLPAFHAPAEPRVSGLGCCCLDLGARFIGFLVNAEGRSSRV